MLVAALVFCLLLGPFLLLAAAVAVASFVPWLRVRRTTRRPNKLSLRPLRKRAGVREGLETLTP